MIIFLIVCATLFAGISAYYYYQHKNLKKETDKKIIELTIQNNFLLSKKISDKDLQFLEFTVDMYIKYAKELKIYSKEQHEYIVKELERIRIQYLTDLDL